jgi:hypothetical protein
MTLATSYIMAIFPRFRRVPGECPCKKKHYFLCFKDTASQSDLGAKAVTSFVQFAGSTIQLNLFNNTCKHFIPILYYKSLCICIYFLSYHPIPWWDSISRSPIAIARCHAETIALDHAARVIFIFFNNN